MARVVVVGAGMAGLAVAARLAALGHDVVVCEQAETWGGKLGTFSRDGFTFDTGPSLLTLPDVYRDLFLATGRPLEESLHRLGDGVAAGQHGLYQILADHQLRGFAEFAFECGS